MTIWQGIAIAALVLTAIWGLILWLSWRKGGAVGRAAQDAADALVAAEEARAEVESRLAAENAQKRTQEAQDRALEDGRDDRDLGDVLHGLGAGKPRDGAE